MDKQKKFSKLKNEFLDIAAHDLRTPMSAIKGYVDMMLSGDFGNVPDKLKMPLSEIAIASNRMIKLINEFLTISRIEQGKITIISKKINLTSMIKSITKQMGILAEKKNLRFCVPKLSKDVWVMTDPDKIYQVIVNLLDNAITYTDKGSVTLTVKSDKNVAVLSVSDTGRGISEKDQKELFNKYHQVSKNKKINNGKGSGLGLGLYISRLIIEKCKGKIWVESQIGKGSKFSFTLPLADNYRKE